MDTLEPESKSLPSRAGDAAGQALKVVSAADAPASPAVAGSWAWLSDVIGQLASLGLHAVVYDEKGQLVLAAPAPAPFFKMVAPRCLPACSMGHRAAEIVGNVEAKDVAACIPGVYTIFVPVLRRRRRIGVVAACLVCRDLADSEEFAHFCQRHGFDREALLRMGAQQARFESSQLSTVRLTVRLLVDQAVARHQADQELSELSLNLTNTYEELNLVYRMSAGMKVTEKPGDYLNGVGSELLEVMGVESLAIRYFRPDEPLISEHIGVGAELTTPSIEQTLWDELLGYFEAGRSEIVNNRVGEIDESAPLRSLAHHRRVRQLAAVPMLRNGKLLGAMVAMNKLAEDFDSVDVKLMRSIADEAGVFLENAFLYEDLQQLLIGMLRALTSAIDAKDPYTCGHSERVAAISAQIARSAGLDEKTVGRVYLSGLLHDIGKIGVPEAVLTKPGRLTKAEFAVMKKHPEIGARILAGIKQVQDIVPGVLYHHERMDGRGYPEGLTAANIPLFGRIVGLADCFDAMTSNRTYRRALPLEVTLTEIRRFAGTQFDPELVEAFFRIDPRKLIQETRQVNPNDPLANVVRNSGALLGFDAAPVSLLP